MSITAEKTRERSPAIPGPSKTSGFALVTSLLVLVALTSLGIGAYFLTNANLRIAENARSNAIAYYNAHEGLDIVLIALAQEYQSRADATWPDISEVRARLPADASFELLELIMDPVMDGLILGGSVTVRGQGPRQAQYETGARFRGLAAEFSTPGSGDPRFGTGWISGSDIEVKGSTTFGVGLWAGRDIRGSSSMSVLAIAGFFQAAGTCQLKLKESELECKSEVQPPPVVPEFDFDAALVELTAALEEDLVEGEPLCDYGPLSGPVKLTPAHANSTICVAEGQTLTVEGTARGLHILGPRSSTVEFDGVTAEGTADEFGVKVAVGTFRHGEKNSFTLRGVNTIYSANDILLDENSIQTIGTRVGAELYVNTLFATERNFYIKADSGQFDGIIWAKGSVCSWGSGGRNFIGAILAKAQPPYPDKASCKPGIYWNGGGGGKFTAVGNSDIPEFDSGSGSSYEAAGILVVSKRP